MPGTELIPAKLEGYLIAIPDLTARKRVARVSDIVPAGKILRQNSLTGDEAGVS